MIGVFFFFFLLITEDQCPLFSNSVWSVQLQREERYGGGRRSFWKQPERGTSPLCQRWSASRLSRNFCRMYNALTASFFAFHGLCGLRLSESTNSRIISIFAQILVAKKPNVFQQLRQKVSTRFGSRIDSPDGKFQCNSSTDIKYLQIYGETRVH